MDTSIYKKTKSDILFHSVTAIIMFLTIIIMVYPFLYIFNYSLSSPGETTGKLLLFPRSITFDSFIKMFHVNGIMRGLLISVLRTLIGAGCTVVFSFITGYVLSKENLVGGKFLRRFFVFTLYIDSGLIPTYLVYKSLNLTGSFWVYIFPLAINVFNVILVKTYCESIPESLEESAIIDGANDIIIAFKIILPMCLPVIAAITLFSGIQQWNAFIDTQLYNSMSKDLHTLQYILYNFLAVQSQSLEYAKESTTYMTSNYSVQSLKMAMTVISVLPILIVYPKIQKYFMSGLMIGAIKG